LSGGGADFLVWIGVSRGGNGAATVRNAEQSAKFSMSFG
jgi:hypothetical protein